jgi:peptide/nickel transport system substrate-binding protein
LLEFNVAEPPFDDVNFRKAIDYAINKQDVIEGALYGHGTPSETIVFPNHPFRNEDLEPRPQDLERAKQLIEQSEYAVDEFSLIFKVSPNYAWTVDAATILQQYFTNVGLDVSVQKLTWSDYLADIFVNQDYQFALNDWFTYWEPFYSLQNAFGSEGAFNAFNYSNSEYDKIIQDAKAAESQDEAIQQMKAAQEIVHEDVPASVMWFRNGSIAAKGNVQNLDAVVAPNNSDLNFGGIRME